jgi:MFS family permease
MNYSVRTRLSTMMALIYAVQGAWWPLLSLHLGDLGLGGRERGWIFATYPLATIVMSLGAGALVDRLMPSQRYLSACYGLGASLLLAMAFGLVSGSPAIGAILLVYWLITAPTYGISNSLAFRNLPRPHAEFGRVRMWGTVGWMVVGWLVSATMFWSGSTRTGQGAYESFWVAAGLSAVLAWFATTLPHTPPLAGKERTTSLGLAVGLLRTPSVAPYLVTAFGVSLTTPFVYQVMPPYLESIGLPRAWASTALTLGQWPEIVALAGLPWLLRRFGYKATMMLGMLAWLVRFASLAIGAPLWVAVGGISLHGIGVACFTVGGQVFLDSRSPSDRRASAQALNMVVTSGLGAMLGSLLAGGLVGWLGGNSCAVFLVPCSIQVGLIGFFSLAFRPDLGAAGSRVVVPPARPSTREDHRPIGTGVGQFAMESADG